MTSSTPTPLGQALGRVPSGLFILTVRTADQATGMLASWVQQAGFEPPMLTVAVQRDRYIGDWIVQAGAFTLSQIAGGQKRLLRHFARGFEPDQPAFEGLDLLETDRVGRGPILAEALSYLDLEVTGDLDTGGDHRLILGRIVAGAVLQPDAQPMVHIRHYGFHY